MKILSALCLACTLLSSGAVAHAATTTSAVPHQKKARHTHNARQKGKHKHGHTQSHATPSASSTQPEAGASSIQPTVAMPHI